MTDGAEPGGRPTSDPDVVDLAGEGHYELRVAGRLVGLAAYQLVDGAVALTHTEIDPTLGGQGLGSRLVRAVLDDLGARGRTVIPACSFVEDWIDRHPAYRDLVADHGSAPARSAQVERCASPGPPGSKGDSR